MPAVIDAGGHGQLPLQFLEQAHRHQGIRDLVIAAKAERHQSVIAPGRGQPNRRPAVLARRLDAHTRVRLDELGARQIAHRHEHVARFGRNGADDDRDAAPDDAGFFRGDRRQRVAEILLVIEIDRGDGRRNGLHDVRRVEASAKTHLEHRDVHARAPEELEGDCRGHFEECRRRFERSIGEQAVDHLSDVLDQLDRAGSSQRARHRPQTVPRGERGAATCSGRPLLPLPEGRSRSWPSPIPCRSYLRRGCS